MTVYSQEALGRPCKRKFLDWKDLCAVLTALTCCALSICVVVPQLSWAWNLGFDDQIVIIGLLLGVENLCLMRIAPRLAIMVEHRFSSCLQNYDALLRQTIFLPHTGLICRLFILLVIALPLGLSVAYKRFTGGHSSHILDASYSGNYSLGPPPLGFYSRMNNSIYYMTDALAPFMLAARNDSIKPDVSGFPVAYGYNTLLLSASAAASLDMPKADYILKIRSNLTKEESRYLSATVGATVARQNTSVDAHRNDDTFWQAIFDWNADVTGDGGLTSWDTFNHGYRIGVTTGRPTLGEGAPCFLGAYLGMTALLNFTQNAQAPESMAFRQTALMFNIRRERCIANWKVNSTSIQLMSGSCSGTPISQDILVPTNDGDAGSCQVPGGCAPYSLDALPVLGHTLDIYTGDGLKSPWRLPAYATSAAAMYWARLAAQIGNEQIGSEDTSINYPANMEHIISTRTTLNANRYLYVVLGISPLLTVLSFFGTILFQKSPFSDGFGMIAILSGIDRKSLGLLDGAALSGELAKPVYLEISTQDLGIEREKIVFKILKKRRKGIWGRNTNILRWGETYS